jgi:hypothetical protein
MSICGPCQPIENEIIDLRHQIEQIQSSPGYIQGPNDPNPGRPDPEMFREVQALSHAMAIKSIELDQCIIAKCGGLPDLLATLTGTFSIATTSHGSPFGEAPTFTSSLLFHKYDHSQYDILSLALAPPPLVVPIVTTVGPFTSRTTDTVTIAMVGSGSGTYDSSTKVMTAVIDLSIHHSYKPAGDSTIRFTLSTSPNASPPGSPLDSTGPGHVTLAGSGVFVNGWLDKSTATLVIAGTIAPHP